MNKLGISHLANDMGETSNDKSDEPTRVLFVDQSGRLGGAEFALLPLAAAYRAHGEVVLLSDGPFRTSLQAEDVRVQILSDALVSKIDRRAVRLGWITAIPAIMRQILALARVAKPFEVLFLNTQKSLVLGALGKPFHRKPVVWFLHDIMTRAHFGTVQLGLVRWLARHAVDYVVANSRASADALIALTGLPNTDITVVHNGIDVVAFQRTNSQAATTVRLQLGLPETAWLVGLFGRLAPWKGQHIALEAIARLPDTHLALVGAALFGEDDYVKQLHDQARTLGIQDRVHFMGFRDDIPACMKAMDLILHTSTKPEPFGRVVVEGMAAGRPVLAMAEGGVLEIIKHGQNGWLVRPGDANELAHALDFLRSKPELLQELSRQAVSDAQQNFSIHAYLEKVTVVIEHAAARAQHRTEVRMRKLAVSSEIIKPRPAASSFDQEPAMRTPVDQLYMKVSGRDVSSRLDDPP
jgi:glycosyltransferase involved in cell wall biosynthesis